MDLLDFARGPALEVSLAIFIFGTIWHLFGLLLLPWRQDRSAPRVDAPSAMTAVLLGNVRKMWPHKTFVKASVFQFVNGYVFHIGLVTIGILVGQFPASDLDARVAADESTRQSQFEVGRLSATPHQIMGPWARLLSVSSRVLIACDNAPQGYQPWRMIANWESSS